MFAVWWVCRLLQKLLETSLKLQEYDQDRTNFISRAIHDVRVPITAIQGYCGLLLAGQLGSINAEQAQVLERMQRSLTRLSSLVAAMMDLGVAGHTPSKLICEQASIEACVDQAVHEILPFVDQKQIDLNLAIDPPGGTLLFNPIQLEQVLVNLLDNGCKFTPKRGAILVRGYSVNADELERIGSDDVLAGYRIDIRDTGPGINPQHLAQIFDEYTSYGGPSNRSGAGLGLAICRMIVTRWPNLGQFR
jgi:two-component system phosphate regulon sensor histidine kinase PhoR